MAPLPSGTGRLNPNHITPAPSHACARSVLYPLEECDGTRELCGPLPNSTITASHPEWVRRFEGDACPQLLFNSNWSLKAYHEPAITLAARSGLHPVHGQANCAINIMRCGRHCAATGLLWFGSGRFHAHGCKLRRALAGPWRPRVDRNLPQPDGILNLIGGSGSLEQSAPSPLQVAVSFNWILKGAGHGCLLVSAAVPAPWPSGIQFPNSLSGDAV